MLGHIHGSRRVDDELMMIDRNEGCENDDGVKGGKKKGKRFF